MIHTIFDLWKERFWITKVDLLNQSNHKKRMAHLLDDFYLSVSESKKPFVEIRLVVMNLFIKRFFMNDDAWTAVQ
jgi:hypothetical protein